jgi:hypothetical protein
MAGALTPRALSVETITCLKEPGGMASFEIRGEEGCYWFDSLKIEMAG